MKVKYIVIIVVFVVIIAVSIILYMMSKEDKTTKKLHRKDGYLTPNFTLKELTDNKWATAEEQERTNRAIPPTIIANLTELAENLQVLRDHLGKAVNVNIAYRPRWWEIKQGRTGTSQHTLGKAADITVQGMTPTRLKATIEKLIAEGKMKQGGLGLYNTFIHYDTRGHIERWRD